MRTSLSSLALVAAFAFSLASPVRAQVIYDNLGSNAPFPVASGFVIGTAPASEFAVRFTAGNTLLLDYANLRLWTYGTFTGTVAVLTNGVDNRPATVLESATVSFPAVPVDFSPIPLTHAEFSNSVLLTAGTFYWLAVSPAVGSPGVLAGWDNTGLPFGTIVRDTDAIGAADPWSTVVAGSRETGMRVFGVPASPVPEPSTYGAIAGALLAGIAAWRQTRRAKQNLPMVRL